MATKPTTDHPTLCPHWADVIYGLAGAAPPTSLTGPDGHDAREAMKTYAAAGREIASPPHAAAFRAPFWLLHAFSHWCRAWGPLQRWPADEFDSEFPYGLNFRRYLGAWLWSVGVPRLQIAVDDLEAIHTATGVAALPHPLLPLGFSEFQRPGAKDISNEAPKRGPAPQHRRAR